MSDPRFDFGQTLPMALLRAREAVMTRVRPMLRAHGVTEQQWRVLRILMDDGAMEAAELARRGFLLRPSLTRILRDLQARGYVARAVCGTGLKRSLLSITPSGQDLIAETMAEARIIQAEIERVVGLERIGELKRQLAAMERSLNSGRG